MKHFTIKTMSRSELDIAVNWAAQEGWNPGLHDADCYYAADPRGFLLGWLDDEPIASISVVRYDASFGFLGFYIVKPEYRGQGYGLKIWKAGLEYLAGCNIGLDGVVAQQENYKKSGFKLAYRNIRYAGSGGGVFDQRADLRPLTSLPFAQLEAYQREFFPVARPQFDRTWMSQADSSALALMQDGELVGYALMRQCRQGYKIGPLLADTPDYAETLFLALKSQLTADVPVYLDTPEVNPAALALAHRQHMVASFETARMYTQTAPELPLQRTFGVTSFEIG